MAVVIETKSLTKKFGHITAVEDLTLAVEEGAIYGFVGPNGAGKTSTMRMLTTLLTPSSGQAWVAGHSVQKEPRAVRHAIGYMPDFFGVYDDMRVWEYLDFFAACYDVPEIERPPLIRDLLELVDLSHRHDDMVDQLSRGMKQRLCLARTLAHDPQVLILDEPASGLDPRARIEIRQLLVELSKLGKTIFFSSHILSDVAEICTDIGIVEQGRLVVQGNLEEMQRLLIPHREISVTIMNGLDDAKALLGQSEVVENIEVLDGEEDENRQRLQISVIGDDEVVSALLVKMVEADIKVVNFAEETRDLEEIFMRATKGIVS